MEGRNEVVLPCFMRVHSPVVAACGNAKLETEPDNAPLCREEEKILERLQSQREMKMEMQQMTTLQKKRKVAPAQRRIRSPVARPRAWPLPAAATRENQNKQEQREDRVRGRIASPNSRSVRPFSSLLLLLPLSPKDP